MPSHVTAFVKPADRDTWLVQTLSPRSASIRDLGRKVPLGRRRDDGQPRWWFVRSTPHRLGTLVRSDDGLQDALAAHKKNSPDAGVWIVPVTSRSIVYGTNTLLAFLVALAMSLDALLGISFRTVTLVWLLLVTLGYGLAYFLAKGSEVAPVARQPPPPPIHEYCKHPLPGAVDPLRSPFTRRATLGAGAYDDVQKILDVLFADSAKHTMAARSTVAGYYMKSGRSIPNTLEAMSRDLNAGTLSLTC